MDAHSLDLPSENLSFGLDYQKSLLRLICEDPGFGFLVMPHLQSKHFDSEILGWAWDFAKTFHGHYGTLPTLGTIRQQARTLDPRARAIYEVFLDQVTQAPITDARWMKDKVLDFIKRNIFVRSFHQSRELYNTGKVEKAYDLMMAQMETIYRTVWSEPDETWFFDDLAKRQSVHMTNDACGQTIPTGWHRLDIVLNGGLSKGELGIWIAYAKGGKSSSLINHGVAATKLQQRPTAHFVFEGSRQQVEDRYEACFNEALYSGVRNQGLDSKQYQEAFDEYKLLKGKLYVRGFVEEWNYSCVDIHETLKELKRTKNWDPDLVIVDYGDLLTGRDKHYSSEREKQKAAYRDLKSLANRGYAVWTASQAQRPEKGKEDMAHWIYARQIADCYEKVRVADFLGSLNQSTTERADGVIRIQAELYRDNAAGDRWVMRCDFSKMLIKSDPTAFSRSMPDLSAEEGLSLPSTPTNVIPLAPKPIGQMSVNYK